MKRHSLIALLAMLPVWLSAQQDSIVPFNGIVTDLTGAPLRGVKVYVVDANYAAKSDRKGRFGLSNVRADDTLHVLYKKTMYDIPVAGRKAIRIRLADQKATQVEEDLKLVDIGYGFVSRRESLTPSSGISGDMLRRTGKYNLLEALVGLVPGLLIQPSLIPGGESNVHIRGISSITQSTTPLFLVDGMEVNSLDFVDVNTVESVEVLKDGSIYGVKGGNGVISVHLKKK
ncbi:MAG: TonB-dependent receptor plug domain-containing protein [Bacteroidales bacterium]|nr:TonB-dependent receptor plug domain-containing protein [Bacteroidales bacterium]